MAGSAEKQSSRSGREMVRRGVEAVEGESIPWRGAEEDAESMRPESREWLRGRGRIPVGPDAGARVGTALAEGTGGSGVIHMGGKTVEGIDYLLHEC